MGFRHAFDCKRYDGKTACDCPCWVEIIESNVQTGEERVTRDCQFRIAPRIWVELIRSANRPAAAIESTRNELVAGLAAGFAVVADAVGNSRPALPSQGSDGRVGE